MDLTLVIIISSLAILGALLGWALSMSEKFHNRRRIDKDIDINKNRINWWKDKNIK